MNFINIISQIEKTDPEIYERLSPRRQVLKSFTAKVAVAALPFAIGSLFKKAYGKSTDALTDILNFALELEYLEYNYYRTANNTGGLIPDADKAGFVSIENHEKAHINFLSTTIAAAGEVPFTPKFYNPTATNPLYVPTAYDFTAGGKYPVFSNYGSFLTIAQALEDTGVRAYKGQIVNLLGNLPALAQAQRIHCVEARHAAHVRLVRRFSGAAEYPAPWITNNIPPVIALQPNYLGEDNVTQRGVTISSLTDNSAPGNVVPVISATAAFDEGLDKATVAGLIAPFKR